MRCCVYKERAILGERVKLAMGGDKSNPNVIEVIDIACDECPVGGYEVTDACRGCLAHRCEDVCKRARRDHLRPAPESAHRQVKVRRVRPVREGLPLQRHRQPQASLRECLQGQGHRDE